MPTHARECGRDISFLTSLPDFTVDVRSVHAPPSMDLGALASVPVGLIFFLFALWHFFHFIISQVTSTLSRCIRLAGDWWSLLSLLSAHCDAGPRPQWRPVATPQAPSGCVFPLLSFMSVGIAICEHEEVPWEDVLAVTISCHTRVHFLSLESQREH